MSISFGSINTGLPKDIVQQIIAAEKIPLQRMAQNKGKIEEKKSLVQDLTKRVQDLRDHIQKNSTGRSLKELKVDSNSDMVDKNVANVGNYQFEVTQLAQKSSAMTSGFADKDDSYVGVGFIRYNLPDGETKEVYVDSDNASLSGVAKLINKEGSNGMRATVVNDGSGSDTPWRLVLSLENTGDKNRAEFPHFYFVDGEQDLYVEKERPAQDAKIKLDGFEIEVPGNKVEDIIPGVTIDLKKAEPGEEFSIKISEDVAAVSEKIQGLTDKINSILTFINEQNNMDENTDSTRTLGGDLALQTLESRIRRSLFTPIKTQYGNKRASDLGISFNRQGVLEFDQSKFDSALSDNYEMVSQILTGQFKEGGIKEPGFMDQLKKMADSALQYPAGVLQSRSKSLQSNIDQIDRRVEQKERMIANKEERLKQKFARLESTISRIKGQGAGVGAIGGGGAPQGGGGIGQLV